MNILYDGPYDPHPKAGVVKYFREISYSLSQNNSVFFSRHSNAHGCKNIKLPPFTHFRPNKISFYLEYLWHRFAQRSKIDIVHPTEFQLSPSGIYLVKKGAKLVITIHDLIHEKFGAPEGLYNKKTRLNYYEKADGYIFVSNSTKEDFKRFYPSLYSSKPSKVIWHGRNFEITKRTKNQESKQFLFVGSRSGYKNFKSTAKAFCEVAKNHSSVKLLIAGAPPLPSECKILHDYKTQVEWIKLPSKIQLRELYQSSLALLYTSNYEGFGMPLVEAMSLGCIPIAGNHSSIPEVLGQGGITVDQNSPKEIAKVMKKCLADQAYNKAIISNGYKRAELFDWKVSATSTFEFYQNL